MSKDKQERGLLGLRLANGKAMESMSGFELACFLESKGSSIVAPEKRHKGGKSKGARNRTKPSAKKIA